jgi:hypothetical protein
MTPILLASYVFCAMVATGLGGGICALLFIFIRGLVIEAVKAEAAKASK